MTPVKLGIWIGIRLHEICTWSKSVHVVELVVPSWPSRLEPQAHTLPSFLSARLWFLPAAIATTPVRLLTETGTCDSVIVLLPSWPSMFLPQLVTVPSGFSARLWPHPPDSCVTAPRLLTETGVALLVVELLPSWPLAFKPHVSGAGADCARANRATGALATSAAAAPAIALASGGPTQRRPPPSSSPPPEPGENSITSESHRLNAHPSSPRCRALPFLSRRAMTPPP